MLGSRKKCSNCHGTSFRRVKVNRTIQCESCKLILEERFMSDLGEYHAITQTEEVHCVVSPDHLHNYLVDDIPNDPYCTPGFITAFRMLSPLREPVYAASARTLSGSLAEMERIIGETLFSGYVGYNGRAPGSAAKKEELSEAGERNKSGGDARHTLVAYFEIVELASILSVDRETTNLAIRTFRHTANNTSLRNRNVESLATAAFVSAADRRWLEYQDWLKEKNGTIGSEGEYAAEKANESAKTSPAKEWPTPPRQLTVDEISTAANLDVNEVLRYLKVVNVALRKERPENSSSITTHMPTFCHRLDLPEKTRKLALGIAEKAMQNNICSRRNPGSISAASIYMACQLDGIRKTQTEICRATTVTEVTLRKVHKELSHDQASVVPDWYHEGESNETDAASLPSNSAFPRNSSMGPPSDPLAQNGEDKGLHGSNHPMESVAMGKNEAGAAEKEAGISLVPPPLPPGFGKGQVRRKLDVEQVTKGPGVQASNSASTGNPMFAMLNNPAMQVFANAFSNMPQLIPPPPPPLPPSLDTLKTSSPPLIGPATSQAEVEKPASSQPSQKSGEGAHNGPDPGMISVPQPAQNILNTQPPQPTKNLMAGVMGIVKALQAFQAIHGQPAPEATSGVSVEQLNSITMMAMAMAQAQNASAVGPGTGSLPQAVYPPPSQDASQSTPPPPAPGADVEGPTQNEQTQLEK